MYQKGHGLISNLLCLEDLSYFDNNIISNLPNENHSSITIALQYSLLQHESCHCDLVFHLSSVLIPCRCVSSSFLFMIWGSKFTWRRSRRPMVNKRYTRTQFRYNYVPKVLYDYLIWCKVPLQLDVWFQIHCSVGHAFPFLLPNICKHHRQSSA